MVAGTIQKWAYKWTKSSAMEQSNYMVLFYSNQMKTNIMYSIQEISNALSKDGFTTIPREVLQSALHSFLHEQVYGKGASNAS